MPKAPTCRIAELVTKSCESRTSTIGIWAASMTSSFPMQDMSKPHTLSQNGRLVAPFPNPATN